MFATAAVSDFASFGSRIASPALRAVAGHWNQARKACRMPAWSELSPAVIAPHLGLIWAFKYDQGTGEFTARLAGNRMMVGFGKSFRGTPLQELHTPQSFAWIQAGLTRVVSEPACYRSCGRLFRADGRTVMGERIVLPLASDGSGADGALGASYYDLPITQQIQDIEVIQDLAEWFPI
jgi:hypothetical protein